jgi:hypothetical protein
VLMRSMVDNVDIKSKPNLGTVLKLVKKL